MQLGMLRMTDECSAERFVGFIAIFLMDSVVKNQFGRNCLSL
jgi:hypothetical protein